ncbi:MAG: RNA polymerase sigma factor [Pseudomonadota bacterium]
MAGETDETDDTLVLYQRWHGSLVMTARKIVRDPAVAEELAQESWVRWLGAGEVKNTPGFLRRTVINSAIDWLRSAKSERERIEATSVTADPAPDTEQIVIGRNMIARVDAALAELGPNYRDVFNMRCIDGLTYDEIGRALGVSGPRAHQVFRKAYLAIVDHIADTKPDE